MPKRRTDDVVHAVMTDHYIQRFKPDRDLLAPLEEEPFYQRPYRGEVKLYYPTQVARREKELYLAVAQVEDKSNLEAGIANLERAIRNAPAVGTRVLPSSGRGLFRDGSVRQGDPHV